jgi:glycosyltransferase involved in cell wall biosynthesis
MSDSIGTALTTSNADPARPVVYDMTRLVTRVLTESPNGIDRVDLRLARYFAFCRGETTSVLLWTIAGQRLFPASVARRIVNGVEDHWREFEQSDADGLYEEVVQRIITPRPGQGPVARPAASSRKPFRKPFLGAIWNYGLGLGQSPERKAPRGAAYLNASHFPLEYAGHLRWLFRRPDIRPAFFIHDLLPIEKPQYFWPKEPERHRRRLEHIRQVGGRAIVASATVAAKVKSHFESRGYSAPILQATLPVSPVFHQPPLPDDRLMGRPYFIACGTIEARKNHIFLLQLWREMAQTSAEVPALVIVGKRGWNAEAAIDMLERSHGIARHVVEVSGLSTSGLKRLMDSATALLAPSLAEGFGLPIAEAAAAGLPVIAADIDAFRELVFPGLTLIDTLDGLGWLNAIREHMTGRRKVRTPVSSSPSLFETSVESFLRA